MTPQFTVLLDAPDGVASEIQIAKLGEYKDSRYGDFGITKQDVEDWKTNLSKLPGARGLIDLDHRSDKPSPHRDTEAAGWITDVFLDADEIPKAKVEWTPKGEAAIKEKRYLFISPSYGPWTNETGETTDNVLSGAALTNKPFLNMASVTLASAERVVEAARRLETEETQGFTLEQQMEMGLTTLDISDADRKKYATVTKQVNGKTVYMFPLPPGDQEHARAALRLLPHSLKAGNITQADADKVTKKANAILGKKLSDNRGRMDITPDTLKLLGIEDEATQKVILDLAGAETPDDAAIAEAIKSATTPKVEAPKSLESQATQAGKVVLDQSAVTELIANAKAGAEAKQQLEASTFDNAFDAALRAGKVAPAQKETYEKFYTLDKDTTLKALEENAQIVTTERIGSSENSENAPRGVSQSGFQLDQEVRKYMADNNIPASDYADAVLKFSLEGAGA
jgi:phage I-like protein